MRDTVLARRRFLRICATFSMGAVVSACTTTPPAAPAVAPTLPPELATAVPVITPFVTATATPQVNVTATPRLRLPPAPAAGPRTIADIGDFAELVKRAQAEGELSVIGLSREWLNYGEIIESYKNTYGIRIIEQIPDASSSDQIAMIRQTAGQVGIQVPDVVEVGLDIATIAASDGLFQRYQHQLWDEVPSTLKDAAGLWCAGYYGVMTFAINSNMVKSLPNGWSDLRNSEYKSQFAIPADPQQSITSQYSIVSAALSNAGSLDDVQPGLRLLAELNVLGIFNDHAGSRSSIVIGETPIVPMWSYIAYALKASSGSNPPIAVVVPEPIIATGYACAINAYATHPYAARLWVEHVFANTTQMLYAKAFATPARLGALIANAVIPVDKQTNTPTAKQLLDAQFLSLAQQKQASSVITSQWDNIVNLTIIK